MTCSTLHLSTLEPTPYLVGPGDPLEASLRSRYTASLSSRAPQHHLPVEDEQHVLCRSTSSSTSSSPAHSPTPTVPSIPFTRSPSVPSQHHSVHSAASSRRSSTSDLPPAIQSAQLSHHVSYALLSRPRKSLHPPHSVPSQRPEAVMERPRRIFPRQRSQQSCRRGKHSAHPYRDFHKRLSR